MCVCVCVYIYLNKIQYTLLCIYTYIILTELFQTPMLNFLNFHLQEDKSQLTIL